MSEAVTVLLMLEAIDKASQIIEGISGKLDGLGHKAADAAAKASMTGEELQAAQLKAEAAANAYSAAVAQQDAAQARLLESTTAVKDAQNLAAESAARLAEADAAGADVSSEAYARIAEAASSSAAAVKVAVAEQVTALDALNVAQKEAAARSEEAAAAQDAANTSTDVSGAALKGLAVGAAVTAAAVAGIGYESIKAAASFQSATTVLVTSGGETAQNIEMVRQGILGLASSTGTATQELTNGMYMIGSAGYTAQSGLNVLRAAAQGAKAENADLGVVSNALTTVLKDYGTTATSVAGNQKLANAAMDQMIAVVQNGKTTTEALAGSLSNVLPIAAAAGLSFAQVGGAMATMTGQGMSAQQSAQDLANTIRSLQNPNSVAINEMQQMGLNANQVSQQLGSKGLTGTLQELTAAITQHMGPSGQVVMSTFQNAKAAAADANTMIKAMPSNLQALATAFLNGSVSSKQWRTDLQGLDPVQAHLMTQFATTAEKAQSFNSLLSSGSPAAQTYTAALSKMLGGATGLNTALMLTGGNMATFQANVKAVGDAGKSAGADVNGWAEIQQNMNQKLDELKQTAEAAAIQLGTALLPMVTKILDVVMKVLTPIATWIEHNKTLAAVILLVAGGIATFVTVMVAAAKAITIVKDAWTVLGTTLGLIEPAAAAAGTATAAAGEEMAAAGAAADVAWGPWLLAIAAIAVAAYEIVEHWSTVKRWLSDFWDWLKQVFDDAVSFVKGHVHEIAAGLTLLLGPIGLLIAAVLEIATHWRQVQAALKDVWNWMVGAAKDVAGAVTGAFHDAVKFLSGLWKGYINDLKQDWALIKDAWNATGGKAVHDIAHAFDQVTAAFDKEWSKISGDLSSIWGSLKQIWDATGGAMLSAIEQAVSDVVGFVESHWSQIKNDFEDVLRPLAAFARAQWDLVKGVFATAFGLITGLVRAQWSAITGVFKAAWDVIRGIVQVGWDLTKGIFAAAYAVITGVVRAGWDIVTGIFKAAWDVVVGIVKAAWDALTTVINVALDLLKGIFKAFADLLTGQWGKLWGDVKSTFSSVWNDIFGFFKSILGDIESTVSGAGSHIWSGFIGAIESALSGIGHALSDVGHAVLHAFDDAGSWLWGAGKAILDGLINGAKSAVNDVKNFFTGLGHDIVSWKGPPDYDKVMLSGNGKLIMQGLITGIDSQTDALRWKLGQITTTIKADMVGPRNVGQAFASGLGAAASSGAGGGTTIINQFSGNQVISDSEITKFASMVGSKVTTQIAPQGGVNLVLR